MPQKTPPSGLTLCAALPLICVMPPILVLRGSHLR